MWNHDNRGLHLAGNFYISGDLQKNMFPNFETISRVWSFFCTKLIQDFIASSHANVVLVTLKADHISFRHFRKNSLCFSIGNSLEIECVVLTTERLHY